MYSHHHSYSYHTAAQYTHYIPAQSHPDLEQHSAPPYQQHYHHQELASQYYVQHAFPSHYAPHPPHEQSYDPSDQHQDTSLETQISVQSLPEAPPSPEGVEEDDADGDDADGDYHPGGSTSRARQSSRKKSGGRKIATKSSKGRGAASYRRGFIQQPVLTSIQPNIPDDPQPAPDADGIPPNIKGRLKNFSGTLLAYPPGSSLDINNLLIVTPAPSDGDEDDEYEKYTCRVCSKTYAGRNARSVARRHLQDKHNVPLSAQPRRSRWEKEPNRPTSQEEARQRSLDQKRTWAKNNRDRMREFRQADQLLTYSPYMEPNQLPIYSGGPGRFVLPDYLREEAMPSELDAEGEMDEDVPMTAALVAELGSQGADGIATAPAQDMSGSSQARLESPLELGARAETPVSSPPAPPNTAQWLQSISSSAWSAQVLPSSAPSSTTVHFGVASMPHGMLHPPFTFQPAATGTEAYIEPVSSASPPQTQGAEENAREQHLISVADSLLNMHSTPITSPHKTARKALPRMGIQLHFSPIQPRSRSTSTSWNLTIPPSEAHRHSASDSVPQSAENAPASSASSHLAVRPRPAHTRSLVQPLAARPGVISRSISMSSQLDDPFAEPSPRIPIMSSPVKDYPISSSPTNTSSLSERDAKTIAVSFDLGSLDSSEASSSKSSASPEPSKNASAHDTETPSHPSTTCRPSSKQYPLSSSSLLSSSAVKSPLGTFKTPLTRRVSGISHSSTTRTSSGMGAWMLSSPANVDAANELGLAPDHYWSQSPGYLKWVQQTPGSVIRRKPVVGGDRRPSMGDNE